MDDIPSPVPLRNRANMPDEEYEKAREDAFTYFSKDRMPCAKIVRTLNVSKQFVRRYITTIICKLSMSDWLYYLVRLSTMKVVGNAEEMTVDSHKSA